MSAVLTAIAESVKDRLNATSFTPDFRAVRGYRPTFELGDLDTLQVVVVPRSVTIAPANRAAQAHDYAVDIGVLKKLVAIETEDIDPLIDLVESIADTLRGVHQTANNALWQSITNDPPYDLDYLVTHRQFASVLTITYRVLR